jgi:mRNA interferase RelE/StbE
MWRVVFSPVAFKQLKKLDRQTQIEINSYIDRLREVPDAQAFGKPLVGTLSGLWRYRVGKYRMICELQGQRLVIEIIEIGKRDQIYR